MPGAYEKLAESQELLNVFVKELDLKTFVVNRYHLRGRKAQVITDKKPWSFMVLGNKQHCCPNLGQFNDQSSHTVRLFFRQTDNLVMPWSLGQVTHGSFPAVVR